MTRGVSTGAPQKHVMNKGTPRETNVGTGTFQEPSSKKENMLSKEPAAQYPSCSLI